MTKAGNNTQSGETVQAAEPDTYIHMTGFRIIGQGILNSCN